MQRSASLVHDEGIRMSFRASRMQRGGARDCFDRDPRRGQHSRSIVP